LKYVYIFILSLFFPLISISYLVGFDLSTIKLVDLHNDNHLLFVIDSAPVVITLIVLVSDYIYFKKLSSFRFTRILHKKIVSNSFDAIIVSDENGIIKYVNNAMLKMFDFTETEILNQNLTIIMPDKHISQHKAGMDSHVKHGTENVIGKGVARLEGRKKEGEIFAINLLLSTFEFKTKKYFSGVITDVSKEVKLEEERELLFNEVNNQKFFLRTNSKYNPC
jgi:PAS domain S-box-containing protein